MTVSFNFPSVLNHQLFETACRVGCGGRFGAQVEKDIENGAQIDVPFELSFSLENGGREQITLTAFEVILLTWDQQARQQILPLIGPIPSCSLPNIHQMAVWFASHDGQLRKKIVLGDSCDDPYGKDLFKKLDAWRSQYRPIKYRMSSSSIIEPWDVLLAHIDRYSQKSALDVDALKQAMDVYDQYMPKCNNPEKFQHHAQVIQNITQYASHDTALHPEGYLFLLVGVSDAIKVSKTYQTLINRLPAPVRAVMDQLALEEHTKGLGKPTSKSKM